MTQLRKQKDAISNRFDEILHGIGPRGSSFTDIDGMSHDRPTHRFLFHEFKRSNEGLSNGQKMALMDLALEERMTVWYSQLFSKDEIAWADMRWPESIDVISIEEFRALNDAWWKNSYEISRQTHVDADLVIRLGRIVSPATVDSRTWLERARDDASLRAFVDAEVSRAHVDLQALRVENEHQRTVIEELKRQLKEAQQDTSRERRRRTAV